MLEGDASKGGHLGADRDGVVSARRDLEIGHGRKPVALADAFQNVAVGLQPRLVELRLDEASGDRQVEAFGRLGRHLELDAHRMSVGVEHHARRARADRKSTRLNSSHSCAYRMPSYA